MSSTETCSSTFQVRRPRQWKEGLQRDQMHRQALYMLMKTSSIVEYLYVSANMIAGTLQIDKVPIGTKSLRVHDGSNSRLTQHRNLQISCSLPKWTFTGELATSDYSRYMPRSAMHLRCCEHGVHVALPDAAPLVSSSRLHGDHVPFPTWRAWATGAREVELPRCRVRWYAGRMGVYRDEALLR